MPGGQGILTPACSPRTVPLPMLFWWRGDAVHLTSGAVDTLTDLSGNGRNATQAVASQRPAWSQTSGPNNTPAMTFTAASHQQLATSVVNLNTFQMDMFCIVKPNGADATFGNSIIGTGDGNVAFPGRFNVAVYGGDYYDAVALGGTDNMDWESAIQPLNGALILECTWDKTVPVPNAKTFINGVQSGAPFTNIANAQKFGSYAINVGGQFPLTGQFQSYPGVIAEIFAYSALLTATEKSNLLRGYLGPRYHITVP